MRIGTLRQRVTIQEMTAGADGQGGITKTFATLARVPASVLPLVGKSVGEGITAGGQVGQLVTRVTIRFRSDISAKQRVVFGSRTFEIGTWADPDGRRNTLDLLCTEVQA